MRRLIILILLILLSGCGDISAPPDATIEIQPESVSLTAEDFPQNEQLCQSFTDQKCVCKHFTVTVKNKDGIVLRNTTIYISGTMASTRYYFYKDTAICSDDPAGFAFNATTGDSGVYNFSIKIPATINGKPNIFNDNIEVRSGSIYIKATITVE